MCPTAVSSRPEDFPYTVFSTSRLSVFGMFSFTVGVSSLLYFSAFAAYSLHSLPILVFIPQLHKKTKIFKWRYLYIFGLLKALKKKCFLL